VEVQRALAKAGGKGDLQPIRHLGTVSRYAPDEAEASMEAHLLLDAGKLLHASKNFWRDGSTTLLASGRRGG
jgi:hypothetical protein